MRKICGIGHEDMSILPIDRMMACDRNFDVGNYQNAKLK
jgi:hypothetical protein